MRFLTAGFSHGRALTVIIDGFPANVPIDIDEVNHDLARRQAGYGRGGRQKIESDSADVLSGLIEGRSVGSPIAVVVWNRDTTLDELPKVYAPRPGHADLPGMLKFAQTNARPILERASARETAVRVVAGSFARQFLRQLGIESLAFVRAIGEVELKDEDLSDWSFETIKRSLVLSEVFCPSPERTEEMKEAIDKAKANGDTLGGIVEVWIRGVPPGLGSFTQWDLRLDGRIAQAVMSVPAIKGVEIGPAFANSRRPGSQVHDPIHYSPEKGFYRSQNNAGGIEGGMSNGELIVVRCAMKPIATLGNPLDSVDVRDKSPTRALVERFDTCAVPSASVVVEAMCLWVIACAVVEKFGGDELGDIKKAIEDYLKRRSELWSGE